MAGQSTRAAGEANLLQQGRINEANQVLDWAPDLIPNVVAGVHPLYKAVETARQRKRHYSRLQRRHCHYSRAGIVITAGHHHYSRRAATITVRSPPAAVRRHREATFPKPTRTARRCLPA
ncbi:MAG: hypothetical protein ACYCVZ_07815 [Streptosporangiaceae bacterium]